MLVKLGSIYGILPIKKATLKRVTFVPRMGIEPTRPNGHMALNHACLPVPAPR